MRVPSSSGSSEPSSGSAWPFARTLLPLVCALAPGFVAGVQLAGLLFFLNPHWPFQFMPLLRATALYSVMLGIGSALLVLPFTWGRPDRARRLLPWALCAVFATAAAAHWVHAARFSLYLPAGINQRLLKAALWVSLAAVIAFYTALLHSLQKRPYGRRSRAGFLILALMASYVVFERRDAFRPKPPPTPRASTISISQHPTLLVVGIEGLTLDVVLPLAEQGELPFFAQFLRQGSAGRLAGITPSERVPSWFTLATGKFPFRHGVVGDRRYSADFVQPGLEFHLIPVWLGFKRWGIPGGELPGGGAPADGALALWEITAGLGIDTAVINWPGAALKTSRTVLSTKASLYAAETATVDREALAEVPTELQKSPPEDQLAFAADMESVRQAQQWLEQQRPFLSVPAAASSANTSAKNEQAESPGETSESKAVFVSLSGALGVSRETFGAYSSVQFEGLMGAEREIRTQRLRSYYRALDSLLHELWDGVEGPRWIVVVSPYGMRVRGGFDRFSSLLQPGRQFQGRTSDAPDGAFLALGPAVEPGRFLSRLEITDLAPTILYGTAFPAARDLDGRVRTEVFRRDWLNANPLTFVPSYETALSREAAALQSQ